MHILIDVSQLAVAVLLTHLLACGLSGTRDGRMQFEEHGGRRD